MTVQEVNLSRLENVAQTTFDGSANGTIGSDILATVRINKPENLTLRELNTFIGNNYPELHGVNIDGIGTQIILKTPIMGTGNEYRYSNLISTRAGAGFQTAMGGAISLRGNPEKDILPQENNLVQDILFVKMTNRIDWLLKDDRNPTDANAKAAISNLAKKQKTQVN